MLDGEKQYGQKIWIVWPVQYMSPSNGDIYRYLELRPLLQGGH